MLPLFRKILDWIFPEGCGVCKRPFKDKVFHICESCRAGLESQFINQPTCEICGHPTTAGKCNLCFGTALYFKKNYGAFKYDDVVREIIHKFKFYDRPEYARDMAYFMQLYLKNTDMGEVDCLVPVPIPKVRLNNRGYNQTLLLAKELSAYLKVPMANLLERVGNSKPQSRLSRKERIANLNNAIIPAPGADFSSYKKVLLIDDIITTGTTLNECAKALAEMGIKEVHTATFAVTELINTKV